MLLHSEFSLFLSEFSACIESILLSLAVLSISWQHFGNFRESSQPEKRGKAETEVGGETWGRETRSSANQSARGIQLVPGGQASVSQYLINKWTQLLSFSPPHSTQFYLGREMTCLFLKFQRPSNYNHYVLEPDSEENYMWQKIMFFSSVWGR